MDKANVSQLGLDGPHWMPSGTPRTTHPSSELAKHKHKATIHSIDPIAKTSSFTTPIATIRMGPC